MKIFRYLLWFLLFLLITLVSVLAFALATQTGLNTLVAVAERVLPGTLSYERIEGRLTGPLYVDNLRYQDGDLDVGLKQFELDWFPSELLSRRLHVGTLMSHGLELHLPEGAPEEEPPPPKEPLNLSDIPLPIEVEITNLSVTDTHIWPHGAEKAVVIDSVNLQARTEDRTVYLEKLAASVPEGDVDLAAQLELAGDNPLEAQLNGTVQHPEYGPLTVQGTVKGELGNTLVVDLGLSGVVTVELDGEALQVLTNPGWSVHLTLNAQDLGKFMPDMAGAELSGKLDTDGTLDDFRVAGELATAVPEVGPVSADFKVSGSMQAIQLSKLTLDATDHPLSLALKADVDLAGQTVDASGQWQSLAWPLTGQPQVESPKGDFSLKGTLQDYALNLQAALAGPQFGKLNTRIQAAGTDKAVKLSELSLRAPEGDLTLDTVAEVSFSDQAFNLDMQWQSLSWPLTETPQVSSRQGKLSMQGTPQAYQIRMDWTLSSDQAGQIKALLQADGTDQAIQISELSMRAANGDLALNVRGEFTFADLSFQADGEWQSLAWPLIGTPQVQSPQGTFKASGSAKDYRFKLNTQVQGPQIPSSRWDLEGQGSDQAMKKLTLNGKLLEGELQADVSAAWQPAVSWQAALTGSGLNPGVQWSDYPGKLALKLQSEGSLVDKVLQATVNLEDLSGTLSGQQVQGKAQVALKDQDVSIQNLQLGAGQAQLQATGSLTQSWDIRWKLAAPDLSRLLPTAAGAVKGSGSVQGPREKPRADLDLAVDKLAYGDTKLQRLKAKAKVDISGDTRSNLDIAGESLQLAGQTWKTISLKGAGTPAKHALQAGLAGDMGRFQLALDGGLNQDNQSWQGRLNELTAQKTEFGDWKLDRPLPLQVSAQKASAEQSCLVSLPTRICIQGRWDAKAGADGKLSLERLETKRFAKLMPETVRIDTSLGGTASVVTRPDGSLKGKVDFQLSPGNVTLSTGGSPVKLVLPGGKLLQAESDGKNASAQLSLDVGDMAQVRANLQVKDLPGQRRLGGKVNANIKDLGLVSSFVPQVQNVAGQVVADLSLAGTLVAPLIGGSVRVENVAAEVPMVDLNIHDVQLAAVSDGKGALNLSGSARSGEGELGLLGQVRMDKQELKLNIKGENFAVADSPEINATLSPDINLSVSQKQIRVDGELTIPKAFLSPPGGGGSSSGGGGGSSLSRVGSSPDVVIVTEADGSAVDTNATAGPAIFAKVRVILGDVRVSAFDFEGNLTGNLLVQQTPQLAPRGTGTIGVEAAEYVIAGQRLKIEHGRVLFSGSPLDNPGLDLRVKREIDNFAAQTQDQKKVTAGAQVTGTLRNPKLTLFSIPPMPDSSILSYLVLGRAPESDEGGSFAVGRYLSPDLYVGYGIGIFDAVNTFLMRWRWTDRIDVEANTSSRGSGGDLFYTFEVK